MADELTLTDSLITPPLVGGLSLAYAKLHIRALGTADDSLIDVYINAAVSYFEEQTGRQVITATRETWLDAFPFVGATGASARIELPHPPLQSVTSITYVDSDGVLQTLDDGGSPVTNLFDVSTPAGPYARRGSVAPLYGASWPTARAETGAVRIRYVCGYGDTPDEVPDLIRGILCYLVGQFDTYRSPTSDTAVTEIPYGVRMLMDGFKYSAYPSQLLRESATGISSGWL